MTSQKPKVVWCTCICASIAVKGDQQTEHTWCVYHSRGEGYELLPLSHSSWHVLITHHFDQHEIGQAGLRETGVVHGCVWHLLTQVAGRGSCTLQKLFCFLIQRSYTLSAWIPTFCPNNQQVHAHIGQPKQLRQLFLQKYSKVRPCTDINFKLYFQTFSQHNLFKFLHPHPFIQMLVSQGEGPSTVRAINAMYVDFFF